MIETGAQIRAARALLNWSQTDLARAVNRHKNAIAYWEGKDEITKQHRSGHLSGPRVIERAFEERGIAFLQTPELGVRRIARPAAPKREAVQTAQFPANTHAHAPACHGVL